MIDNWNNKHSSEQMRIVRGYAIISKGDTPQKVDRHTYQVPSQSGQGTYKIIISKKSTCTCPDFIERKTDCKHIHAVKFYLEFHDRVKKTNLGKVIDRQACPYCQNKDTIGCGKRKTKSGQKQVYQCKACKRRFIEEKDFQRYKGNGKTMTLIMDLYFKGISTRGISDHLEQFYSLKLDHSNIIRRIHKYSNLINEYVKTLKPELASIWQHDEMKIQAGGKWKWLWNIMDEETKFLITTQVSQYATIGVSKKFFSQAREQAKAQPEFLITDGRHPLNESIKKELPNTHHVRLVSIRDKRNNTQDVERLNGTFRDRVQSMRGFQNEKTAEIMTSGFRNYYNFIKPHNSLNGSTPAFKAGIGVNLEGNRWMTLIKKAQEQ